MQVQCIKAHKNNRAARLKFEYDNINFYPMRMGANCQSQKSPSFKNFFLIIQLKNKHCRQKREIKCLCC